MFAPRTLAVLSLLTALGCKGSTPQSPSQPAPQVNPAPTPAPPPTPAAQPAGPRTEVTDPKYTLVIALAGGAAAADPARFTIELHGQGGYHVNDQYPIAVDLTVEGATAEKTALRRADAAEISQAVARFDLPVRPSGPHPTVRGRMRFAVCTEAQCAFETKEFAVAL